MRCYADDDDEDAMIPFYPNVTQISLSSVVCLLPVTFMRHTQAIKTFGNIFAILAILFDQSINQSFICSEKYKKQVKAQYSVEQDTKA